LPAVVQPALPPFAVALYPTQESLAQLWLQVPAASSSPAGAVAAAGDSSAPGSRIDAEVVVVAGEVAAVAAADIEHLRKMESTGKRSGPEASILLLIALAEVAVRETQRVSSIAVS